MSFTQGNGLKGFRSYNVIQKMQYPFTLNHSLKNTLYVQLLYIISSVIQSKSIISAEQVTFPSLRLSEDTDEASRFSYPLAMSPGSWLVHCCQTGPIINIIWVWVWVWVGGPNVYIFNLLILLKRTDQQLLTM